MNVELKKVKIFLAGSDETYCFTAELWLDHYKRGTVSNDGHGGCNMYSDRRAEQELQAWANTLPRHTIPGIEGDFPESADGLVGDLVERELHSKDLKRKMGRKILFTKRGMQGLFETSMQAGVTPAVALANQSFVDRFIERHQVNQLLNLLPFNEALPIYISNGR